MNFASFALIQMLLSGLLMILQLSLIPVFFFYPVLCRRILYRILLSITLSDFLQLFAIFHFSFYQTFDWKYSPFIEKLDSGMYIIAWDHLIVQHFLLAMNRLSIILKAYYWPAGAKNESGLERAIFNSLLIISWFLLAALLSLFMTPICGGVWDSSAVGFFYNLSLPCSAQYRKLELYSTIGFPTISLMCYVTIIVIVRKFRGSLASVEQVQPNLFQFPQHQQHRLQQQHNQRYQQWHSPPPHLAVSYRQRHSMAMIQVNVGNAQTGLFAPFTVFTNNEKRILLLSSLLFTVITALIIFWYADYRHPPWTMLFCAYLLVNTSLTLAMNTEYRYHYVQMWRKITSVIVSIFI